MQTSKRKLLAVPAALAAIFLTGCHWHHRRPGPPPGRGLVLAEDLVQEGGRVRAACLRRAVEAKLKRRHMFFSMRRFSLMMV